MKINYIIRVVETENKMFKFDLLFRNDFVITDGKNYKELEECLNALKEFVLKTVEIDKNNKHFIINNFEE